ncbi:hypothetical protein VTO42DRAFT_7949 [Malbranchea cinnamomea]
MKPSTWSSAAAAAASSSSSFFPLFVVLTLVLSPLTAAVKLIKSNSLDACIKNSNFTASLFDIVFTPDNRTVAVELEGVSSIAENITAQLDIYAYGYKAVTTEIDPCESEIDLAGMCPLSTGPFKLERSTFELPGNAIDQIPSVAYTVPDIDLRVEVWVRSKNTGANLACLEAQLQNGNTVYHKGVAWAVAVIAGLGLVASAITSGLGHSNTAAHVAANALSLFGFFQAQAMIGMTSVTLPPIVQSWTQNFQWSMGIIHVDFLEALCTWYQRATGGEPSSLLSGLSTTTVKMQKRALDFAGDVAHALAKRTNNDDGGLDESTRKVVVRGIERVGYRAKIERSNIFMTGLVFFVFFVAVVLGLVAAFKGGCEIAARKGWTKSDKFRDFRKGWKVVLRGILFRLTLIGYPQMCVLCLWEFTHHDSAAEVVLAVFMILAMTASLGYAAFKVIWLAKKSVVMHQNPAYILYSDPSALNKWGFLYVQYRATAYWFVVPTLVYILVKGMFIGLAQPASVVMAVALLLIELALLVAAAYLRPWMDKKTNVFNISIAAINFLNVILLLFFTQVFKQPGLVTGIMGVAFFVINAAFALILLVLVLIASVYAVASKNPDTRYQPMRDDRGSFIKSQTQLTTELDALGATARGDQKLRDLEDDHGSSSDSLSRQPTEPQSGLAVSGDGMQPPRSPVTPSVPLFPSSDNLNHGPPQYNAYPGPNSGPVNRNFSTSPFARPGTAHSNASQYRAYNNNSPWQRGAGYDP